MIAIIYLNNEPFYCYTCKDYNDNYPIGMVAINNNITFKVLAQIKHHNALHLNCELNIKEGIIYPESEYDIKRNLIWKQTPGNIKPIWVENNYGKQITFLIE